MKKVKFLKDHVNGIKKGDVGEFSIGRAEYLVRGGVAEYVTNEPLKEAVKVEKKAPKKAVKEEPCKTC